MRVQAKCDLLAALPLRHTMRFGSTAKVLAECELKYYRISECGRWLLWQ